MRPLFWTIALTLIVAQTLAFWLVCSYQVQRAQARQTTSQVVQTAFSECLEYVQGSTIASCQRRVAAARASR